MGAQMSNTAILPFNSPVFSFPLSLFLSVISSAERVGHGRSLFPLRRGEHALAFLSFSHSSCSVLCFRFDSVTEETKAFSVFAPVTLLCLPLIQSEKVSLFI